MRIGINASFLRKPNTGIGQVTINFLETLAQVRTDNLEFVLYLEEDIETALPSSFYKRSFLPKFWKRDDLIRRIWWEKFLLPREVKKDKCDVLFSLYQSATIQSGYIPHVMLVHDLIPRLFPEYLNNTRKKLYQYLVEKAIRKADKIVANSKRTEKDIITQLGIRAGKITTNYIDVDAIYKEDISDEKSERVLEKYHLHPGYILAGGGMEVRKNIEGVIRAYKMLLERNKMAHFVRDFPQLVIYGKLLPELVPLTTDAESLVRELNLTEKVKLLGMVAQDDLPAIFGKAVFFIYPSFYEGFGIPPLEAMNQGTPVIVAKTSSLPEVGGDSVLYCHPEDVRDIATVMRKLLTNQELRKILAKRAKERAKIFSWENFSRKLLNILINDFDNKNIKTD